MNRIFQHGTPVTEGCITTRTIATRRPLGLPVASLAPSPNRLIKFVGDIAKDEGQETGSMSLNTCCVPQQVTYLQFSIVRSLFTAYP